MRLQIAALMVWVVLTPALGLAEKASIVPHLQGDKEVAPTHLSRAGRIQLGDDLDALFLLQDVTARGRQDAAALQKPLLVSIGEKLSQNEEEDPERLAPYVVGYVLSGGNPETAEALSKSEDLPPAYRRLLMGVSLFMRGDGQDAAKLLSGIDTSSLPARIAGRVALAQALLEKEPSIRQSGLSVAIASMPGTLVEESALRRSALAFADTAEEAMFWRRLERYQRRFPNSLYAQTFWKEVMVAILRWSAGGGAPNLMRLDLILREMPVSLRRALYLHLARLSSRAHNVPLLEFAARRVQRLAVEGSQEDQAAGLYLSLYSIASDDAEEALANLSTTKRSLLTPRERALLDAGLFLAGQISRPAVTIANESASETLERSPLQSRAEDLLTDVDKLLAESNS